MDDDSIVITPVGSLPQGIWNINKEGIFEAEPINDDNGVTLKSKTFMNIEQLLGQKWKKYEKIFMEVN